MKGLRLTCPLHGAAMDLNIHVEKKKFKDNLRHNFFYHRGEN